MNQVLAGIYGTAGAMEKIASSDGQPISTLADLALALISETQPDERDLVKIASMRDAVTNELVDFDRAGRAMAHHEFTEMEKLAAAGDWSALESFFSPPVSEAAEIRQAVLQELQTRLQR